MDIGSNDSEFWFWISKAEPVPYVFHCGYQELARGGVDMPFPFQPDMIVADSGFSIIGVLLNDGTNDPFKSLTGYNVGSQPSGIALGDFNGDGKLDIAVSNQDSNDVTVLINNGAGLFPVSHTLAAGTDQVPSW